MKRAVLTIALIAIASCSPGTQKQTARTTDPLASLDVYQSVAATPAAPVASLSPAREQEFASKWRPQGWIEVASVGSRLYMTSQLGLQAIAAKDGTLLWRNMHCHAVGATLSVVGDELFTACAPSLLTILSAKDGHVLRSASVQMYGINSVTPAGKNAFAVEGWIDGAALVSKLVILRRDTLKPISPDAISDATFLGVIGDRAYIDDWCCNGRPDEYRPATIYSISLRDGTQSNPIDLTPDPDQHPANVQPLGQGERNYMQGRYLYVPVDSVLYRYDILHLNLPPRRTPLASPEPQ